MGCHCHFSEPIIVLYTKHMHNKKTPNSARRKQLFPTPVMIGGLVLFALSTLMVVLATFMAAFNDYGDQSVATTAYVLFSIATFVYIAHSILVIFDTYRSQDSKVRQWTRYLNFAVIICIALIPFASMLQMVTLSFALILQVLPPLLLITFITTIMYLKQRRHA